MKKLLFLAIVTTWLVACNIVHKPDINGSDHQPMMHGWTHEQAGEYWLQSVLDKDLANEHPMTAEQLSTLDDENIQVHLPLAPEGTNPKPRTDVSYRQQDTDGFVTFSTHGGTLMANVLLKEPMYFDMDSTLTCYVQQRGRGIYTLYYITDRGTKIYPNGRKRALAAVIAVFPGGDSIRVNRGNTMGPDYYISDN